MDKPAFIAIIESIGFLQSDPLRYILAVDKFTYFSLVIREKQREFSIFFRDNTLCQNIAFPESESELLVFLMVAMRGCENK